MYHLEWLNLSISDIVVIPFTSSLIHTFHHDHHHYRIERLHKSSPTGNLWSHLGHLCQSCWWKNVISIFLFHTYLLSSYFNQWNMFGNKKNCSYIHRSSDKGQNSPADPPSSFHNRADVLMVANYQEEVEEGAEVELREVLQGVLGEVPGNVILSNKSVSKLPPLPCLVAWPPWLHLPRSLTKPAPLCGIAWRKPESKSMLSLLGYFGIVIV